MSRLAAISSLRAAPLGFGLLLVASALPGAASAAASAGVDLARLPRAEAVIREEMQAQKIPGVGFAVIDHGKVILAKGYGYANLEHSLPVSADTVFHSRLRL